MKGIKKVVLLIACVILTMGTVCVWAASENAEEKIKNGVSIDSVDVSGMTASEATKALKTVVSDKTATTVTLDVNGKSVQTTLGDLGYKWSNKTVVDEAVNTGKTGNIIKRYKDGLDLQHNGMKFNIEMSFNKDTLKKKLQTIFAEYEIKAKNASLEATGHGSVSYTHLDVYKRQVSRFFVCIIQGNIWILLLLRISKKSITARLYMKHLILTKQCIQSFKVGQNMM